MSTAQDLITKIKAHIAKGDKAAEKSQQHYIAAGQYLVTLKASHAGTWEEWEALLKDKVHISTGRASELMQIADGRKTIESVRAGKAESMKRLRASSPRGEENAEPGNGEPPKPKRVSSQDQRELQANIDELEAARVDDRDLAEQLQAAKIKIAGLESEVEELKAENASLREQLAHALATKPDTAAPKKRGRPPGSKNKPKPPVASAVDIATPDSPVLGNDPGPIPEFLLRVQP